MSHIVEIKSEIRDPIALAAACRRMSLPEPVAGTGLLVKLPGWLFPVVVDPGAGKVQFDNYGGQWGDPAQLDRLLQAYAIEKATIEARKRGHSVVERALADGSVRLTISVGGVL